jgi:hypothetical protein
VDLAVDRAEKARRVRCYQSQITLIFASWFRLERDLPASEGFWLLVPNGQRA